MISADCERGQCRAEAARRKQSRGLPLGRSGTLLCSPITSRRLSPEWGSKVGSSTAVEWPAGIGAKGMKVWRPTSLRQKEPSAMSNMPMPSRTGFTYSETGECEWRDGLPDPIETFQAAAANAEWGAARVSA